jgi:hypothetical protein
MAAQMIVELADGNKIYFGRAPEGGLDEVTIAEDAARIAEAAFRKGLGALGSLVGVLHEAVGKLPHRPEGVELEFRASLSAECNLFVLSGDGEAEFKVTLRWGKE